MHRSLGCFDGKGQAQKSDVCSRSGDGEGSSDGWGARSGGVEEDGKCQRMARAAIVQGKMLGARHIPRPAVVARIVAMDTWQEPREQQVKTDRVNATVCEHICTCTLACTQSH